MTKIALSPSTQEWNKYATGQTEEGVMNALAELTAVELRAMGYEVLVCGRVSWKINAQQSNDFHAQVHVAQHSNAGGGVGTEIWYKSGSTRGLQLAENLYDDIAPITSSPDRGIRSSTMYGELNNTVAPAVIIEYDFHDRLANATELIADLPQHAKATAKGIHEYCLRKGIAATPPDPVTPPAPQSTVYRFRRVDGLTYFLTASESEKAAVMGNKNYVYEGVAFPLTGANSLPIHRFSKDGFHLYTSNKAEGSGWTYEGIAFYGSTGGTMVSRLRNKSNGMGHLWSASNSEINAAVASKLWVNEGFAFGINGG